MEDRIPKKKDCFALMSLANVTKEEYYAIAEHLKEFVKDKDYDIIIVSKPAMILNKEELIKELM